MLSFKARSSHSRISRSSSSATGAAGVGFFRPSAGRRCVGLRQLGIAREYAVKGFHVAATVCGHVALAAPINLGAGRAGIGVPRYSRHHRFPRFRRCQQIMFTSAIGPDSMAGWTTTNRALPRSSRRFVA